MTSLPRLAASVLPLLSACALAQPSSESPDLVTDPGYYLAGSERIELRPTDEYFALRVAPDDAAEVRDKINASSVVRADRSELLDRYRILLLRRTKGRSDADVARVLRSVGFNPDDVPVFTSKGIFLVLLNDFSLQLIGSAPACMIENLAERYPQARFTRNDIAKGRYDVTFPDTSARDSLDVINRLAQSETRCVAFASPNFLMVFPNESLNPAATSTTESPAISFEASAETCSNTPNDPLFGYQWYLKNSTGVDIRACGAWALTTGATAVVIAVIDDGVETTHPDFKNKVAGQYDVVSDDADAGPAGMLDGHGTAVAGIAAAATSNGQGMAAIGWNSRIYAVRAFDSAVDSELTTPSLVEQGISKAVAFGAQVINISMSGGPTQIKINQAIDAAIAAGRTLVLSAGNDNAGVNYPANLSLTRTVIAVAATDKNDKRKVPDLSDPSWGSNYGPEITVAAPGVDIVTTDRAGSAGYSLDRYAFHFSGTSAAAPLVAGVAALLLSAHQNAPPASIREWIRCGADDVGGGVLRLNATRSLKAAANGCESLRRPNPPGDPDSQ